jgi:hypothetical protein
MEKSGADLERITQTIQYYFDGMYYRDLARLRQAFHPHAYLFGYRQEQCLHLSVDEWFKMVEARPMPTDSGEPYDMRIISTDVTGAVATVKVADLYQGLRFTDYLTLLKTGDTWVIVNKAFHIDPQS